MGEFGISTSGTSLESEFLDSGKYKVISIGSYSENSIYTDQGIRVNKTNKTESKILRKNDLTMILNDKTASGNIIGRVLLIDADESYVYNQRTQRIETDQNKFVPEFLYQLLNANNIRKKIILAAQGNTQIYVNWSSVRNISYLVPKSKEEQTQIGNFFKQLDDTIALHQRELEKFKILKTSYLENIFLGKVSLFTAKNTITWEQRKLGELGYCQSGIGFPELEQGGKTGIPFYKVSDMNLLGNEIFMENSNNYVSINQITNKKWKTITSTPAVIFAKVGAALMLDRKRLVLNEFLIDNNTMAYIFDDSWHYYFGKTLFDKTYLPQLSQTGALPSFNAKDVEELNVILPTSKEEQTQIGNFFKQLDDTIALHQKELAKYQQIKAACLEKMFVE